jgi:hypothetical protein
MKPKTVADALQYSLKMALQQSLSIHHRIAVPNCSTQTSAAPTQWCTPTHMRIIHMESMIFDG